MNFDTETCNSLQFNQPTSFMTDNCYKKKERESAAPLDYIFDIGPQKGCFNACRGFQGVMVSNKAVPPNLIDIDNFLRTHGLVEEELRQCTDDIHTAGGPNIPSILDNKMVIPDCVSDCFQTTKVRKPDNPTFSRPVSILDRQNRGQFQVWKPARDTRLEVKDAYKTWRQKNSHSYNIPNNSTDSYKIPLSGNSNGIRKSNDNNGNKSSFYHDLTKGQLGPQENNITYQDNPILYDYPMNDNKHPFYSNCFSER